MPTQRPEQEIDFFLQGQAACFVRAWSGLHDVSATTNSTLRPLTVLLFLSQNIFKLSIISAPGVAKGPVIGASTPMRMGPLFCARLDVIESAANADRAKPFQVGQREEIRFMDRSFIDGGGAWAPVALQAKTNSKSSQTLAPFEQGNPEELSRKCISSNPLRRRLSARGISVNDGRLKPVGQRQSPVHHEGGTRHIA